MEGAGPGPGNVVVAGGRGGRVPGGYCALMARTRGGERGRAPPSCLRMLESERSPAAQPGGQEWGEGRSGVEGAGVWGGVGSAVEVRRPRGVGRRRGRHSGRRAWPGGVCVGDRHRVARGGKQLAGGKACRCPRSGLRGMVAWECGRKKRRGRGENKTGGCCRPSAIVPASTSRSLSCRTWRALARRHGSVRDGATWAHASLAGIPRWWQLLEVRSFDYDFRKVPLHGNFRRDSGSTKWDG